MPLHDPWFLVAYLRPVCGQIVFLINLQSLSCRLDDVTQASEHLQLKSFGKIYAKFSDTVLIFNKVFSMYLMTSLLDLLIMLLVTFFLGYDILVHSLTISDAILMLGGVSYVNISGFFCFSILFLSSNLEEKRKILMLKINEFNLKKFHKAKQLSTYQIDCASLELSCGLFLFKKFHIFAMVSSFFSYLIVMIQFDFVLSSQLKKIIGKD